MGWFWSSSALSADKAGSSLANSTPAPPNPEEPDSFPNFQDTTLRRIKRLASRDEIAEAEIQSFLQELEAETQPSPNKYQRLPKALPSHHPSQHSQSAPSSFTLEEELFPTQMSCRDAFDQAFYCQSLGGQFTNLYRYGGMRNCSENWKDFWFCMRTKGYSEGQKQAVIRDHYKKKTLKYKLGPSSEDVWESRDARLEWGDAFSEPVDWLEGSDQ